MLHEIEPDVFDNQYRPGETPDEDSYMILTDGKNILMKQDGTYPQYVDCSVDKYRYICSLNGRKIFLGVGNSTICEAVKASDLKTGYPQWISFTSAAALHIYNWYADNRYCGRCGKRMHHSETERAMVCDCGNTVYPRINPVIIVSVLNKDRLLVTRYTVAHSPYRGYALIAGFAEFGEDAEQTVKREVMEETGVKVKNVRYYKSQPWPYSQSLIMGFICDLDGDDTLKLDAEEISEAEWLTADQIPPMNDPASITGEMIEMFRRGELVGN